MSLRHGELAGSLGRSILKISGRRGWNSDPDEKGGSIFGKRNAGLAIKKAKVRKGGKQGGSSRKGNGLSS